MTAEIAPGYGRVLAEAREAQGLTVAEVADKLKLTARQIEALEAEDASRLPAPVFVRGFIRNYARLVEVPIDHLPAVAEVATAATETITAPSEELRFTASPVRRWLLLPMAVFAIFLVLVAVLYAWLSQGEEAYVPNEPVTAPMPPVSPPVEAVPVAPVSPAEPPAAVPPAPADVSPGQPAVPVPAPAAPPAAPAQPVVPSVQPAPPAPAPGASLRPAAALTAPAVPAAVPVSPFAVRPPVAAPTAPSQAVPVAGRVVQMSAEQTDAWIEVVSGDAKRYTRLLRAGEQLTLRGSPPFKVVVGNAAGVRLSYDGRAIDLKPYIGEKVARLTLE